MIDLDAIAAACPCCRGIVPAMAFGVGRDNWLRAHGIDPATGLPGVSFRSDPLNMHDSAKYPRPGAKFTRWLEGKL